MEAAPRVDKLLDRSRIFFTRRNACTCNFL